MCCGPILRDSAAVEDVDAELFAWLGRRRWTVLVVLGSLLKVDREYAVAVWDACRVLLAERKDVQVLWKLQKGGEYDIEGLDGIEGDRVRVVEWLKPDPLAVLRTGRVACSVNHGGSNSYHEALRWAFLCLSIATIC